MRGVLAAQGLAVDDDVARAIEAVLAARDEGMPPPAGLLATDVDEQRTNPLAVLRSLVRHPTAVLQAVGAPGGAGTSSRSGPSPTTSTTSAPATFADVDPAVGDPGLE